jgi:hypothetical protein
VWERGRKGLVAFGVHVHPMLVFFKHIGSSRDCSFDSSPSHVLLVGFFFLAKILRSWWVYYGKIRPEKGLVALGVHLHPIFGLSP